MLPALVLCRAIRAEFRRPLTMPLSGKFVVRRLGLAMVNRYTKFEVSSISRSGDILRGRKVLNGLRDVAKPISGTFCRP